LSSQWAWTNQYGKSTALQDTPVEEALQFGFKMGRWHIQKLVSDPLELTVFRLDYSNRLEQRYAAKVPEKIFINRSAPPN
jgi:hypothetical protein